MGKMVNATVHETDHQVTVQAVFRKPENLIQTSSSSFYTNNQYDHHYPHHSERSSTYSSTWNSDGNALYLKSLQNEIIVCLL